MKQLLQDSSDNYDEFRFIRPSDGKASEWFKMPNKIGGLQKYLHKAVKELGENLDCQMRKEIK